MRTARLWILAGIPLLLGACGGGDDTAPQLADPEALETAVPVPLDSMGGLTNLGSTVALAPLNDSGTFGEATFTDSGGQIQVMVRLTGAPAGERQGHIHSGTCESLGGVVEPLQPITVGADGTGTSTSLISTDRSTLMGAPHVVNYHGEGGTPIACAPVELH